MVATFGKEMHLRREFIRRYAIATVIRSVGSQGILNLMIKKYWVQDRPSKFSQVFRKSMQTIECAPLQEAQSDADNGRGASGRLAGMAREYGSDRLGAISGESFAQ